MIARKFTQTEKDFFVEHFTVEEEGKDEDREGILIWKKARNKYTPHLVGTEVGGALNHNGYKVFSLKRPDTGKSQTYLSHRVIYFMYHGEEADIVDHIDRDKTNNKKDNLRSVDGVQSVGNTKRKGITSTGYTGVRLNTSGTYSAEIRYKGEYEHIGTYLTAEDAFEAYKGRHKELHGEHSLYHKQEVQEVLKVAERDRYRTKKQLRGNAITEENKAKAEDTSVESRLSTFFKLRDIR